MRRVVALVIALVVAAATLAACSDSGPTATGGGSSSTTTTTAPTTTAPAGPTTAPVPAVPPLAAVGLSTTQVAVLDEPIALATRPGSRDLYVAEKRGRVRLVKVTVSEPSKRVTYQLQSTPLLDISDEVINEGERGLLGLAFSTDGRVMYLNYTREPDGHTVVAEWTLGDRTTVDRQSRRELLVVEQPFANHNGGQVAVGPDGYLYVGLGDGGSGGDPAGHGQDTSTLLGSILRIDPASPGPDGGAYAVPAGNPFADGEDGAPETWLYGVRNPWRFTFDRITGDLWVADVGQNAYEEVTWLPAVGGFDAGRGANLGWDQMEGTHSFEGGANPPGAVLPVVEYGRDEGCAVIGGYVYRGAEIPGLAGAYLFADSCRAGLRGVRLVDGQVADQRVWDLPLDGIYSLGQDDEGELYVLQSGGPVLKITGA